MAKQETKAKDLGGSFLSQDETERIVLMAVSSGPKTERDLRKILNWAEGVRIDENLLKLVLDGSAEPSVVSGQVKFRLTKTGIAKAEALVRR